MEIIASPAAMQRWSENARRRGETIAFVPTMGFLHEGHMSLIDVAKKCSDVVVMSIYVNPTQFAQGEDLSTYPRDLARDERMAEARGVDVVFVPSDKEMYPEEHLAFVEVEKAAHILEGEFRPTHFRGVATVVAKLFNIVKPHTAVFGQKDAQQAFIINKMVKDLNFDVRIAIAPIVREPDGLALSSRNVYLSETERREATVLYRSLKLAESMAGRGEKDPARIRSEMLKLITTESEGKIDYISFVNPDSFERVEEAGSLRRILALLAVRFGKTRLIDNLYLNAPR